MSGLDIKGLRKRSGLTQQQLADLIEVRRQTVLNWEKGATSPSAEELAALGKILGFDPSHLPAMELDPKDKIIDLQERLMKCKDEISELKLELERSKKNTTIAPDVPKLSKERK